MCGEMVRDLNDGLSELEVRRAAAAFFQARFLSGQDLPRDWSRGLLIPAGPWDRHLGG